MMLCLVKALQVCRALVDGGADVLKRNGKNRRPKEIVRSVPYWYTEITPGVYRIGLNNTYWVVGRTLHRSTVMNKTEQIV
jgi:hypothetical protein